MNEYVELYGWSYFFFLIILFLLFKRFLYSYLDPHILVIQLFAASLSFSIDSPFFLYVISSVFAFYCGMILVSSKIGRNQECAKIIDLPLLKYYSIIFFAIYVLANIYLYRDTPIPLFADNPTEEKIASFSEGSGWVRRIIFISSFLPICFSLLILFSVKKKLYVYMLLTYVAISVLMGAKSSFLHILFLLSFLYTQKKFKNESNIVFFLAVKRYTWIACLLGVGIFAFIVLKEMEAEGGIPLYSIGFRLMAAGDVMLYYKFDWIRDSFNYDFWNYIPDEINGITGMFRIVPYNEPIGYLMVKEYLGRELDTVLGPNAPFFIKGHIYFGYLGGVFFCFVVGLFYAWFRKKIFNIKVSNIFIYAFLLNIFFLLINFLKESGMFISRLFDLCIVSIPIILLSNIIVKSLNAKYNGKDSKEV